MTRVILESPLSALTPKERAANGERASRAADRPYVGEPPESLQKFLDAGIGTKSDTLVAEACGVTRQRVQQIRKKLGKASHRNERWEKAKAWLRQANLTGAKTWKALAAEFNAAHGTNVTHAFLRKLAGEAGLSKPSTVGHSNLGKRRYAPDSLVFDLVAKGVDYSEIKRVLNIPQGVNLGAKIYNARTKGHLPAAVEAGRETRKRRGLRRANAAVRKASIAELLTAEGLTSAEIRVRFGYKTNDSARAAVRLARRQAAEAQEAKAQAQDTKGTDE